MKSKKNFKISQIFPTLIDFFILSLCLILVWLLPNDANSLFVISISIIVVSIYMCFKVRKIKLLFFLLTIISFINISIGVSDGLLNGQHVAPWQLPLRQTIYNVVTMKSILLVISTFNVFLTLKWIDKVYLLNLKKIEKKDNLIISLLGTFTIYVVLILGYDIQTLGSGVYVSNSNPLIEYAVIMFVIIWFYSGDNKFIASLLKFYAVFYVLLSLYFGDRSASFLMILTFYLLFKSKNSKISVLRIVFLIFIAVFLANFIAGYRDGMPLEFGAILENTLQRGLYSDTISYSYYASITISAIYHIDDTLVYFLNYLKTWIFGSRTSDVGNLASFVKENYMYNVGGGIYPSYFYFGMGYTGVILSGIALGVLVRFVYSRISSYAYIYKILIAVMSIRWYLYGPTTLYRSILIMASILIIACIISDVLMKRKKGINKNEIFNKSENINEI